MGSSAILKSANKLVSDRAEFMSAFLEPQNRILLDYLYENSGGLLEIIISDLNLEKDVVTERLSKLLALGLVIKEGEQYEVSGIVRKRLDYESFSPEFLINTTINVDTSVANHLPHSYKVIELVGRGATSFTFRAEQSGTYRDRALKIFIPGVVTYESIDKALRARGKIQNEVKALPDLIEAGQISITPPNGSSIIVPCVVFQFIDRAETFADFLEHQDNLNATIFERFVERVGTALAAIEEAGLSHGDLHEGNILVVTSTSPRVAPEFWVIDFIGAPSLSSPELSVLGDIENFRDHLIQAAIVACKRHPGFSARLLLGEKVFRVLEGLRAGQYLSFREMLLDFYREPVPIPEEHFRRPIEQPFEWLRVEFIPSPEWLYKLFIPVPSRYEKISRFGNAWVSGPRGCGKSHYLRVLAFHPKVLISAPGDSELNQKLSELDYDPKKAFGVLFACRLGEFKVFSPDALNTHEFDVATQAFLKHILVLKIWNKTLYTIKEGLELCSSVTGKSVLQVPHDFSGLVEFLEQRLGGMTSMDDPDPLGVLRQCISVCSTKENSAVAVWHRQSDRQSTRLLTEQDLDQFFAQLKRTFSELSDTRFFILVDDASYGNMHYEMQKVLNSLIRAVQSNHCFKVSCDKYMYTLDSSDGRAIDPHQEATYVDLGEVSTKSQRETIVEDLSEYMASVIDTRLRAWGSNYHIRDILGKSQPVGEFLLALSQPGSRRYSGSKADQKKGPRKKAYYAGWNIIWSISHGSVRTLLELVEHVFKDNDATQDTQTITLAGQDNAVRAYSKQRFRALPMLPGEFQGEPLGQKLQAVISAIGEMSKLYIQQYDTGDINRWYETISVERLDRSAMEPEAREVLHELLKYGLLLDEGVTFSRAQFGLSQRYDLNKIFVPAFQITYRVRNHVYLSAKRMEQLLLHPDNFVGAHRHKLQQLSEQRKSSIPQRNLFEVDTPE